MQTNQVDRKIDVKILTRGEMKSIFGGDDLPPPPGCGTSGAKCLSIFDCCVQVCYFLGGPYGTCGPN